MMPKWIKGTGMHPWTLVINNCPSNIINNLTWPPISMETVNENAKMGSMAAEAMEGFSVPGSTLCPV